MINAKEARARSLTDEQFKELYAICDKISGQCNRQDASNKLITKVSSVTVAEILKRDLGFGVIYSFIDEITITW